MDTKVSIRIADPKEVETFLGLLEEAAGWLTARGIRQWKPGFHLSQRPYFERAMAEGELLFAEDANTIFGCCLLGWNDTNGIWFPAPQAAAYISKLVVKPSHKGRQLGRLILKAAEDRALARNRRLIRLDTVKENQTLCHYYEIAGYTEVGLGTIQSVPVKLYERFIAQQDAPPDARNDGARR